MSDPTSRSKPCVAITDGLWLDPRHLARRQIFERCDETTIPGIQEQMRGHEGVGGPIKGASAIGSEQGVERLDGLFEAFGL